MRKEVLKRFAAGTCSVCMLYALSYSAIEAIYNAKAENPPSVVSTIAAATASPTPAATSSSQSVTSDDFPTYTTDTDTSTYLTQSTDSSSQTENTQTITSNSDTTGSSPPTLNEYLSALRCGGCRRNCLLINPRCMHGRSKAETATVEYYELYSDQ